MRPRLTSDAEIRATYASMEQSGEKITIETLRAKIGSGVATARLTEFLRKERAEASKQKEAIPSAVAKLFSDAAVKLLAAARDQVAAEFEAERSELIEGQKLLESESLALRQRLDEGAAQMEVFRDELQKAKADLLAANVEMAKTVLVLQERVALVAQHAEERDKWSQRTRQLEIHLAVAREKLYAADTRGRGA